MSTRIYRAPTSKEALARIHRELGPGATILKRRSVVTDAGGSEVEITASVPSSEKHRRGLYLFIAPAIATAVLIGLILLNISHLRLVGTPAAELLGRDELMDRIELLMNDFDKPGAYTLARVAQQRFPEDPKLARLWPEIVAPTTIITEPAGARVYRKRYLSPEDEWEYLGETPVENVEFPRGFSRVKFEMDGFITLTLFAGPGDLHEKPVTLRTIDAPDADMVFAEGYQQPFRLRATRLEGNAAFVGDFLIDKYEVTNRQYYEFVKSGGYENPAYWQEPFVWNGSEIPWSEAMSFFVDSTGRPGPSTWEAGHFPTGKGDHPVAGVSWYEAAAYAEFAGKELPTAFHWCYAATIHWAYIQYPFGNYQTAGTVPVGSLPTVGQFGTYDLPGNVREWCYTAVGSERCLLGGAWNDHRYMLQSGQWLDPFNRLEFNGFRCIKDLDDDEEARANLRRELEPTRYRDVMKVKPVSAAKFQEYLDSFFAYDKGNLEPEIVAVDESHEYWRREKALINCAYSTERMAVYLFLPREVTPPYQPVVYFMGRQALYYRDSNEVTLGPHNDYFVKSGRALIYPVYWGTYERGEFNRDESGTLKKFTIDDSITVRDFFINWVKDASRTIDYLETREDMDCSRITALGLSMGGNQSMMAVAVDPRFRCFVLLSDIVNPSGIVRPEADSINYISRVKIPTLYIVGSADPSASIELFESTFTLFGTPPEHKRLVILDGGHSVYMLSAAKRESLAWLDKYVGPVNK